MLGETISHYKIIEKLGEGGMGVVYRAVDTKLDREVAIKFLPSHLSSDTDATKRFIHEAKAASAIDHSHIGTIHEIDETEDGITFIVMALYDGETLRERMDRGDISVEEALGITSQIASGLSKTHRKDIVHRDIKPSNIIITSDGEVKIIDFGLAKLTGRTRLTKEASTLGTAAYMSPEQARGEEVDHRSDIFSLGVILYEMLAGDPPFKGEHEAALLYEIVHQDPEPMTRYNDNLPKGAQSIVGRALRKIVGDRYNDINEMISDIDDINVSHSSAGTTRGRSGTKRRKTIIISAGLIGIVAIISMTTRHFTSTKKESLPDRIMIAVLPFANLGSSEDEYFSDGITDAITARLVSVSGLGVIARQSVIQYKNSDKNIRMIAEELGGVEYILEGTVQRERPSDPNSTVRIIPQLIRVDDGIHVWADTYDEEMDKVFAIQSNIAERVVEELNVVILGKERKALKTRFTDNLKAYDYYLRGREYEERGIDHASIQGSIDLYSQAVREDTNFAEAYARLALQRCRLYWHTFDKSVEKAHLAQEEIDRAFHLKPDEPLVRAARGYYYYYVLRDYSKALDEFLFAREHEPNNAFYNSSVGLIQRRMGLFDEGLNSLKTAFQYDPRSSLNAYALSAAYADLRMYSDAEEYIDRAIALSPDIGVHYAYKTEILINMTGNVASARKFLEKVSVRLGLDDDNAWNMIYFDIFEGQYQTALDRLETIDQEVDTRQSLHKPKESVRGLIYELMGKSDISIDYYTKSREILKEALTDGRDEASVRSELGMIYARLDQRDKALHEVKKIVELEPISRDVLEGAAYLTNVAAIYTILGDCEEAMDILESLPKHSSFVFLGYIGALTVNPVWDPLRDNPRFKVLIEKLAYNNTSQSG